MRRRILFIFTLPMMLAGVIMAAAPAALADSPHFIRATGTVNNDGSLTVNFKEAGLGTNENIQYVLSGNATAIYVCVNRGGANPSASNKTAVAGPVTAEGTFNSGKNGQVTASLTVQPPFQDIGCPPGQSQQLASVTYTGMTLTDTTNNVSISLGDFSSGCLLPNVRGAC
jgi:hypothetical protein